MSSSVLSSSDTKDFVASLAESVAVLPGDWRDLFDSKRDLIVTRAPGRLDLMGGIADYSGSLVLQWPIHSAAHVAVQRQAGRTLRVVSLPQDQTQAPRFFEIGLDDLIASDYAAVRSRFADQAENHWAAYVAGAFPVLVRERHAVFNEGAHLVIGSAVPEGKGVSSSAALEVASMQAIAAAYELEIPAVDLALLCQQVENLIVGAPCGVMDQMTAASGEMNRLLELRCQPAELLGTIPLPEAIEVWGIDSGIRHFVGGADYRTVRTGAFMGYRIIADLAGFSVTTPGDSHLTIEDRRWNGYLANVSPPEFERKYAGHLPEVMAGRDFLTRYGGITDKVSSVEPAIEYPVLAATVHPIYENARVTAFAQILKAWRNDDDARKLGELMYESHASYSRCGLGSDGTDALVDLVRASAADDLFGAKITGGGSGGTVAVLGRRGADNAVRRIAESYRQQTGHQTAIISGSSPGASSFGSLRIQNFSTSV